MWNTVIYSWLRVPYSLHVRINHKIKKPRMTVLFLHGIGNSGAAWQAVIDKLPADIRVISIDLLGFGKSPRPKQAIYSAKTQARAVIATVVRLGLGGRFVIVGHSLGALVAVEVAKRYPVIVKSLILCSPPFYMGEDSQQSLAKERRLRKLYQLIHAHPEQFVKISRLAMRYKLVNKAFSVTTDDVDSYIETLESAILNQTSLYDAERLKKPMRIIHGRFDNYVIKANLEHLQKRSPFATMRIIATGHEVRGRYVDVVVDEIVQRANAKKPTRTSSRLPI